jgi:hypothetical protein
MAAMERARDNFLDVWREDWEEHDEPWSPTLIRPAA